MTADSWAPELDLLREDLHQVLNGIDFSHGEIVRQQVLAFEGQEIELPGLICLRVAGVVSDSADAALPGATALTLLAHMAVSFRSLETGNTASSPSKNWGMPRALNGGDAIFALAVERLISGSTDLPAERRIAAADLLESTARALAEELNVNDNGRADLDVIRMVLVRAAAPLGVVLAGADAATRSRYERLGEAWSAMTSDELEQELAAEMRASSRP